MLHKNPALPWGVLRRESKSCNAAFRYFGSGPRGLRTVNMGSKVAPKMRARGKVCQGVQSRAKTNGGLGAALCGLTSPACSSSRPVRLVRRRLGDDSCWRLLVAAANGGRSEVGLLSSGRMGKKNVRVGPGWLGNAIRPMRQADEMSTDSCNSRNKLLAGKMPAVRRGSRPGRSFDGEGPKFREAWTCTCFCLSTKLLG